MLEKDKTVLEMYQKFYSGNENEIRETLHKAQFDRNNINSLVKDLSEGEKIRLSLLIIFASKPNFIILNEPNNHLDIQSREVIENLLQEYNGALLVSSHDRYFLKKIGFERIYELKNKKLNPISF